MLTVIVVTVLFSFAIMCPALLIVTPVAVLAILGFVLLAYNAPGYIIMMAAIAVFAIVYGRFVEQPRKEAKRRAYWENKKAQQSQKEVELPISELIGTVKWFNPKYRYGFIVTDSGELALMHECVLRAAGHSSVNSGDKVHCQVLHRGNNALQVFRILSITPKE